MKKWIVGLVLFAFAASSPGERVIGERGTEFVFPDSPSVAEWYTGYVEHFYTTRTYIGMPVFPKEYIAASDSWLNDAWYEGKTTQRDIRKGLLDTQMDREGYVLSQQHASSSHDYGWPFPVWPQVEGPGKNSRGITTGWHFYDGYEVWDGPYKPLFDTYPERFSTKATDAWKIDGLESKGINQDKRAWELRATSGFPTMTIPEGNELDPFNCPYIQIRWNVEGETEGLQAYMEWVREGDTDWSDSRRMHFYPDWLESGTIRSKDYGRSVADGMFHSILPVYQHPKWDRKITRIRFCLAATDQPPETFYVHSVFSHWDSRHLVNNALYIKAAWEYFRWTGDLGFMRKMLPRLRLAIRYMMEEGHGLELNHIRCTWPGHDGRPGFTVNKDGSKTFHNGHGKGGNYWDLLPLGWDDMYTTTHYYASLLAMAQIEEAVSNNPGWAFPGGFQAMDADFLRSHAAQVKETTNTKFWNERDGRFVGCIDADGVPHDYGYTFINLEAIHYGIANEENAKHIFEWLDGARIVDGDTATGSDIYIHRLAPRASTKRNVEWYSHIWWGPEMLPFGGQVQEGGAVLGFSFYDVMSRIKTLGADDAWARLMEIRAWDEECAAYGGYRKYYGDGNGETKMQGGGTAGGIGIDHEFTESSMLSAVVPFGFMGLRPDGDVLHIEPNLPMDCPAMAVRNLLYQGTTIDVAVQPGKVNVRVHSKPPAPLTLRFDGREINVSEPGKYTL